MLLALCIIFMSLGMVSLTLFLLEKTRKYSVKAVMLKSITSLFFILTAAVGLYKDGQNKLALCVMLGLLFGLLGDIWLDMKYVYRDSDKPYTYAGFVMFCLGHVCYIVGIFLEYFNNAHPLYIVLPLVGGSLLALLPILLEKPMKLHYGKMKWIVFLYGVVLFSMSLCALSMNILYGWKSVTLIMLFVGGILFAISDLILSGTYFGVGKERNVDIISNAVIYYLAQFIIAFALFFIII